MPVSASWVCGPLYGWQLELEVTLDTLGWVKNCLSLVDYFTKLKKDSQAVSVFEDHICSLPLSLGHHLDLMAWSGRHATACAPARLCSRSGRHQAPTPSRSPWSSESLHGLPD